MDNQLKHSYPVMQGGYYQSASENPAVELVIENEISSRKSGHEQQKNASQMPRGTRIDDTGTRIQVRGGRNYTSRPLYISREEMFDDVVVRGLRADGLSTKLGVKNHKDGISKLISELFRSDDRLPVIEEHFKTRRQKSNCAKTMFATMTHEELQFLKSETFPSRIDVQLRDYLTNAFIDQPHKLQATVEVLNQLQQLFKVLTPQTDFLSSHNFQTRGFFLDIILMTCSFLMQIIQDTDGSNDENMKSSDVKGHSSHSEMSFSREKGGREDKTAAEILLSVGSDVQETSSVRSGLNHLQIINKGQTSKSSEGQTINDLSVVENEEQTIVHENMPTTVVVEGTQKSDLSTIDGDQWTTVEMVDGQGNAKYMLVKSDNEENESFNTVKILEMLQSQGITLDENMEIAFSHHSNVVKTTRKQTSEDQTRDDRENSETVIQIQTNEEVSSNNVEEGHGGVNQDQHDVPEELDSDDGTAERENVNSEESQSKDKHKRTHTDDEDSMDVELRKRMKKT